MHECMYCQKLFPTVKGMKGHIKRMHKVLWTQDKLEADQDVIEERRQEILKYVDEWT